MRKMEEYYKVLHYLDYIDVDRFYPCENYFYQEVVDEETGEITEERVPYKSDNFLFNPNTEIFSGVDYIEVLLETDSNFSTDDLSFNFSEYEEGYAPLLTVPAEPMEVEAGFPVQVIFPINRSERMSKFNRNLTGVKSLVLSTPDDANLTVYDVVFRHDNAQYTLEMIDRFIENGKYYILSRLHTDYATLPEELHDHVYTAAAGYAWLSVWEFEARVMNDEQKNAKSYGKWLFADVDDAIENWKITNSIDEDIDYVEWELSDYRWLRW